MMGTRFALPRRTMSSRTDGGPSIDPGLQTLFAEFHRRAIANGERVTLRAWLDRAEAWRILDALREAGGNRSAAARALGIGRRTLYTKMEKLGIHPSWEAGGSPTADLRVASPA
jgi:DNA-binding NtrC family response regulator